MPSGPRIREYLARAITLERERHSWTLAELATKAKVNRSHLGEIERGDYIPNVATLERLCDALGITLARLFADAEAESQRAGEDRPA